MGGEGMSGGYGSASMESMGSGYGSSTDPEAEMFHASLRKGISYLKNAKTNEERKSMEGQIKQALSDRFERQLAKREQEVAAIEERIKKLKEELARRRATAARVVDVQMETVRLAAEGIQSGIQVTPVSP